MIINESFLDGRYHIDKKDRLYAEFYPNGHLKHLGYYVEGSCSFHWALYLDEEGGSGKAVLEKGYGGSADYQIYKNGCMEVFGAWSDNSKPEKKEWLEWVKEWIQKIQDTARTLDTKDFFL